VVCNTLYLLIASDYSLQLLEINHCLFLVKVSCYYPVQFRTNASDCVSIRYTPTHLNKPNLPREGGVRRTVISHKRNPLYGFLSFVKRLPPLPFAPL
jgi:hypothetical protein